MVIKKPKINFVEVRLDQSFPEDIHLQFIAKVMKIEKNDIKQKIKVSDNFGEVDIVSEDLEAVDTLQNEDIVQIFAYKGKQEINALKIKKLGKFDFHSYKQVESLGY